MNDKNFIPKTDQRKLPEGELEARVNALLDAGFSREWIDDLKKFHPALYVAENIDAKIEGLKQRGFSDPQKMITSDPKILGLGFENIDAKIEGLKQRGFSDPQKMITSLPQILGLGFENIDAKIEGLKQRGFSDPQKMITSLPQILGLGFENIDAKIEGLKQRGFSDPQKMITSLPQILGYGFENIDAKIEGLKQRGFSDPQKMITSLPQILGYGFENIDEKIEYLNRVIRTYKLPLSPISLIENILSILGTKMEKLKVLTRVLRRCDVEKEKISEKIIRKIIFSNLEDVLVAVQELDREKEYISQFLKRVDSIKKRKISKEKKRETIKIIPDEKIKRTYFRGYSEK